MWVFVFWTVMGPEILFMAMHIISKKHNSADGASVQPDELR